MAADSVSDCEPSRRGRFDIRFQDGEQEAQFKLSSQRRISSSMLFMAVLTIICYFVIVVRGYMTRMQEGFNPFSLRLDNKNRVLFWVDGLVYLLASIIVMCFVFLYRMGCCPKHWNLEAIAVFFITVWSAWMPWADGWSAYLHSEIPDELWDAQKRAADGTIVLALDFMTTAVCLFVPIRLCLKWIPPVGGLVSFMLSGYFGSPRVDLRLNNTILLFSLTVCALMGAWSNEVSARERFIYKSEVLSKQVQLEQQHASLSRILDRLCDGLVHLRETLTISNPSPRLGALLMSMDWKRLSNAQFCDYITNEDDRTVFVNALRATPSLDSNLHDGMVNLHLRDVCGREFLVYAYHASYRASDGECRHVVGLVEALERPALAPESECEVAFDTQGLRLQNRGGRKRSTTSSCRSSRSVDTSVFADALLGAVFEVDARTFRVLNSCNLSNMFESLDGRDFTRIFQDSSTLPSWLSTISRNDRTEDVDDLKLGPVRISMQGYRGGHKCKLRCEVDFEVIMESTGSDDDDDSAAVQGVSELQFQVSRVHYMAQDRSTPLGTNANLEWESLSSHSLACPSVRRVPL
eukprot:TRINITY_DN56838_c0_g1_i1.p1 TRINITY_DN56838_c0_g1~~TRINITY_DN56838_c0_g1_i1.p1  ORF type:complete len:578 (-),score=37.18 TRINITY_DN56838_c0_g1_i1:296-2029(-)